MNDATGTISTFDLRKSFSSRRGTVEAVRGVSLQIGRGEIFGLLGPNGAGKTTTLRMFTTLLPIDAGRAEVAGIDVSLEPKRVRERIGYVSQLGGSDDMATGRENLLLQGRLYGASLARVAPRVEELIGLLDLAEFADRRVKTYSGGQRRRLDVALGIVHHPAVLFLDEPTTGLDPQNRANLWDHLRNLRDQRTTIVLTTHYLEEADALCDRLVIADHGTIVAEGTPRELKRQVTGDAVVISVRDEADAGDRSVALLGSQPYVREISASGDQLRLYVEDGGADLPRLLRVLDDEHIAIRAVNLSEPTLDDVFLRKTGRSLRDAGTAGGSDDDARSAKEVAA